MGMFKPNVSGYNKYVQRLHGRCKESCFFFRQYRLLT